MRRRAPGPPSILHRVGAALVVTVFGLGLVSLALDGFASSPLLRLLQGISLFGLGTLVVVSAIGLVIVRLGGWRDPDAEFEELVERSERLGRLPNSWSPGSAGHGSSTSTSGSSTSWSSEFDGDTFEFPAADDYEGLEVAAEDEAFDALVRAAIEELPIEFHRALEHVAIIVSDSGSVAIRGRDGRRRGAYGMYQGDTVAHDYFTERILIFRDTLLRDFGHDPELLGRQVRRVLRHELAHHLGWGERGVRNLGL
jgi:predicted Zn-dependent protease with MMP-like domain